jgi:hypothetical protein
MGRRFQEQFINKHKPQVSGGMRTVQIRPEHMTEVVCACGKKHFDRSLNIYRTPAMLSSGRMKEEGLSMVEVMRCRRCGGAMVNDKMPAFLKEHGQAVVCKGCGKMLWEQAFIVQRVSKLMTGAAEDQVMLQPAYFCRSCGVQFGAEEQEESRQDAAPTSGEVSEG